MRASQPFRHNLANARLPLWALPIDRWRAELTLAHMSEYVPAPAPMSPPFTAYNSASLLYDLAMRRHEFLMRSYDSLNTRTGAVFAFSSAILAASSTALKEIYGKYPVWVSRVSFGAILICFLLMGIFSLQAYLLRKISYLPDSKMLHDELHFKPENEAKSIILYHLLDAEINPHNDGIVNRKGQSLNRAIVFLFMEVALLFVALCLPYLRRE